MGKQLLLLIRVEGKGLLNFTIVGELRRVDVSVNETGNEKLFFIFQSNNLTLFERIPKNEK